MCQICTKEFLDSTFYLVVIDKYIIYFHENAPKFKICFKKKKKKKYLERDRPSSSALYILWQKQILFFQKIYF